MRFQNRREMPMIRLFTSKCTSLNVLPNVTNGVCLLGNTKQLSESSVAWDKRYRRCLKRLEMNSIDMFGLTNSWIKRNQMNKMSSDPNLPFISRTLVSRPQPWWPGYSAGDFSHINHTAWPAQCDVFPHPWSAARVGRLGSPKETLRSHGEQVWRVSGCALDLWILKFSHGSFVFSSPLNRNRCVPQEECS